MCHLIFFIPFFALPVFWLLPFKIALTIYLFVCVICFFVYFKIYQAMRLKPLNGREAMLGETGRVVQDIDPEGKIQYATEIWNAMANGKQFTRGDEVIISGFSWGLSVLVEDMPGKRT